MNSPPSSPKKKQQSWETPKTTILELETIMAMDDKDNSKLFSQIRQAAEDIELMLINAE